MDITNLFSAINWTTPSWDLFIIIFFIVAVFLFGFGMGRNRILITIVSIYMTLALIHYFPFATSGVAEVKFGEGFILKISIFLGTVLALFFLLARSALTSVFSGGGQGSWFQVIIFSFLQVGLLISVILSFLPAEIASELLPITKDIFTSDKAQFAWLLAPILAMIIIGRGGKLE